MMEASFRSSIRSNAAGDSATELDDNGVQQMTESLSSWKEFLVVSWDILTWKKMFYSYCIGGMVTFLFLIWWYLDLSVVTTLAIILFIGATADFAIPSIGSKLLLGAEWTGEHERKFETVCEWMLVRQQTVYSHWDYVRTKKETNPVAYIVGVMACLFLTGLLGYWFNNTILVYLTAHSVWPGLVVVLFVSLYPGLQYHGILQKIYINLFAKARGAMRSTKAKVK